MDANYHAFITRLIRRYEGGYGWNQKDKGGPTNFGITCYDYAEHLGEKMESMTAWAPRVRAMPLSTAEAIYKRKYARGVRFDQLRSGPDCLLLDYAVNSGVSRAVRVARAVLKLPGNGVMTHDLVEAVNKADPIWFIDSVCKERLHFMRSIRGGTDWKEFGRGWKARVDDLERYCRALVTGTAPGPAPDLSNVPTPKVGHPVPKPGVDVGGGVGGGVGAGGAAHAAGLPGWVVALLVAIPVLAGVAYFVYRRLRAERLNRQVILPPTILLQPPPMEKVDVGKV